MSREKTSTIRIYESSKKKIMDETLKRLKTWIKKPIGKKPWAADIVKEMESK